MRTLSRRLLTALTTLALLPAGLAASATAASAATDVSWQLDGNVGGVIRFTDKFNYTIYGSIYVPSTGQNIGYESQGQYFEGNARITCGTTIRRNNSTYGVTRSFTDSAKCSIAKIQIVQVAEYVNNSFTRVIYVTNPYP